MNRYEVVFITLSDLSKEDTDVLIDRYKQIIANFKGVAVKVEKWGVRKLAYPIRKQTKGMYALIDYVGSAAVVVEVERNFKFDDKVLKFQTIKKEDSVDMAEIEKEMAGEKEKKPEGIKPETEAAQSESAVAETEPVEAEAAVLSNESGIEGEGEKE